jgi:hypothetical protein
MARLLLIRSMMPQVIAQPSARCHSPSPPDSCCRSVPTSFDWRWPSATAIAHAELVSLGIGHHDLAQFALADVDALRAQPQHRHVLT